MHGKEVLAHYTSAVYDKVEEQRVSLTEWLGYLNSPDALYPMWFKYYAVRSLRRMGSSKCRLRVSALAAWPVRFELDNLDRAARQLARAYLGAGSDIFEGANKYFAFLKACLKPPQGGW